jgi:outer membrane protein assembly factor BamB
MKPIRVGGVLGVVVLLAPCGALAYDLRLLAPDIVHPYSTYPIRLYVSAAIEKPFRIDLDPNNAIIAIENFEGIVAVPAKGLSDERIEREAVAPGGCPLCVLFLARKFPPLADGKPIDAKKLSVLKYLGIDGSDKELVVLHCAVKKTGDADPELWVWGAEKEPLLKLGLVRLAPLGNTQTALPFQLRGRGRRGQNVKLVLNLGDKYVGAFQTGNAAVNPDAEDESIKSERAANVPSTKQLRKGTAANSSPAGGPSVSLFQFGAERTGYLRDAAALPKQPRTVWKYATEMNGQPTIPGDPLVHQGTVFFGDNRGTLRAIDAADGNEKWVHDYGPHLVLAAPAAVGDRLFVASRGDVKCVSCANGQIIWQREMPKSLSETSPLPVGDAVFVATADGNVHALKQQTGEPMWHVNLLTDRPPELDGFEQQAIKQEGMLVLPRSAASDGTTLFQSVYNPSRIVALDCKTGRQRWSHQVNGWVYTNPAVSDNYIVVGSEDMSLHCLDAASGKELWSMPTGNFIRAAPAIANGRVFFVSCNERAYCVDLATGKQVWFHKLDQAFQGTKQTRCAPLVTDDTVYVGAADGQLYAFDSETGDQRWGIYVARGCEIGSFNLATDGHRLVVASRSVRNGGQYGIYAVGD